MKDEKVKLKMPKIFKGLTNYHYIAIALSIIAFFIYLNYSTHCLWIDEARDLFLTRGFLRNGKLTYLNGEPWVQHPLTFYILIATSSLFFGMTNLAGQIVVLLIGSATVYVMFLLGKEIFNEKAGIIAALLIMFNPLFWFYTDRILNDVPVMFFVSLSIYLFIKADKTRKKTYLYSAGAVTAVAILTKISAVGLLPVLLFYLIYKYKLKFLKQKKYWIAFAIFIGVFSVWILYNLWNAGILFPFDLYFGRLTEKGTLDAQAFFYYIQNFSVFFTLPLTIMFVIGTILLFIRKNKEKTIVILWFTLFLLLMSLQTVKVERYILPVLPAVVLIAASGLEKIMKEANIIFPILGYILISFVLVYILFIGTNSYYSTGNLMIEYASTGFCGLKEAGEWIKTYSTESDVVLAGSNTQTHWYSDRAIVSFPQNESDFDNYIEENNISFIVVDVWERTQPDYVYQVTEQGTAFWYPNFLNNTNYPTVNGIEQQGSLVALIYYVNVTSDS